LTGFGRNKKLCLRRSRDRWRHGNFGAGYTLDLQSCEGCGGQVRVIACVEDPLVIGKILAHRETRGAEAGGRGLCSTYAQGELPT
jgi:hypothetical protein